MSKKILFVANTDIHISLCYLPYMKYFKDLGYTIHVATNTSYLFANCDKKIEIPISRNPFKLCNVKAIFKLKKILKQEKYDLVSASTPMGGVIARLAALKMHKEKKLKVMYTAHGFHFYKNCSFINWVLYYPVEKLLMKCADVLVTINKEDYDFAKKHFQINTKFIDGVGFDEDKFAKKTNKNEQLKLKKELGISKDQYVISYIAEISKRKRQKYLIDVLSNANLKNVIVLLAGMPSLENKINKLIKKRKLENQVKVLGFRHDISAILDITDLVISVSKQEGLPLNIMEAMKKEKPIVVTNCRGNRDLIKNNVNGIIVPLNDKKELIDKINYIISNPDAGKKLGESNSKIIDKYSIKQILPKYVKIYMELLNEESI